MGSLPSIEKLLFSHPQGVLSLVGGGGKTSLMFQFARLLVGAGKRVLTTTTTKVMMPTREQAEIVVIDGDPLRIVRKAGSRFADAGHICAAAGPADGGKLRGFGPEKIAEIRDAGVFDWIIVEADGSARLPLKAPAQHEPVIPAATTVLVAVAGLEVVGQPLTDEFVFRSALAAQAMDLAPGKVITPAALSRLFTHPMGAFKGAPSHAERYIFLNKADDGERIAAAGEVAAALRAAVPPARALLVGQARDQVVLHAMYPFEVQP